MSLMHTQRHTNKRLFKKFIQIITKFFIGVLSVAAAIMAAHYEEVLELNNSCLIPLLFGDNETGEVQLCYLGSMSLEKKSIYFTPTCTHIITITRLYVHHPPTGKSTAVKCALHFKK